MGVTRLAINRPIAILMLVTAFFVLGIISYFKLPAELNPQVDFGVVTVITTYAGTNPQEMETLVTKPIEDSISGVSGLRELSSTSQQGISTVRCQFYIGTNLDSSAADLRQKVDAIRQKLPRDADSPVIQKRDTSAQPIMYLAMRGGDSSRQLRVLADNVVVERLQQAPDVAAVSVFGGDQREIRVAVRRDRLAAYGLNVAALATAIAQSNSNVAVGYIQQDQQYASVRFLGEFVTVNEIRNLQIPVPNSAAVPGQTNVNAGRVINVSDIANVEDTTVERTQTSTIDGADTVTLAVQKTSDGNTLKACDGIKQQLVTLKKIIPSNVTFETTLDSSKYVHDNLKDVMVSLCLGALLAITIVFIFLHNVRATIIIAIAIPVCIVSTFLPISALGFTLNTMTLLGLSLAIGILIDDSIVVLENIVRHLQLGEDPVTAAIKGRTEIGLAAVTLTAVDLVVFVPIAFMGGVIGEFFRSFGASISIAVLFSLFVSFTLTPMLASRWFKKGEILEDDGVGQRGFAGGFNRRYHKFADRYRNFLAASLRHPWTVVFMGNLALILLMTGLGVAGIGAKSIPIAVGLAVKIVIFGALIAFAKPIFHAIKRFVRPHTANTAKKPSMSREALVTASIGAIIAVVVIVSFGLFGHTLGFRFAPGQDQNQVAVAIETPAGSSLSYTKSISDQVERRISNASSLKGDVKYILTSVGQSNSSGDGDTGTQYANIQVSLYDKASPLDRILPKGKNSEILRTESDADVAGKIREMLRTIPGAVIQAYEINGFGGGGAPLNIRVVGTNLNDLLAAANAIKAQISKTPGVYNTDLSFKASQPELQIRLDRTRTAHYGFTQDQVSQAVATAMQGNITSKFRDPADNQEYNIRIQLANINRNSIYEVGDIPVGYQGTTPVHLGDVANITLGVGPTRVDRLNRLREISVTGYLLPGTQIGNIKQKVDPQLKELFQTPEFSAISYEWGGEAQALGEEMPYLFTAVFLGIILAYMLMAALFNNMLYPLSVMLTLPQALVGALIALYITNTPFSLIAAIGVIMLNGLAAKNAILMVDYTNTLRARGYERIDAILTAAPTRLRPILMTSAAIICATLPTALALGRGAGFRQSLGIVVVGGVIVSTVLTLIVIPCVYLLFDNLSNFLGRLGRRNANRVDISGDFPTPPSDRNGYGNGNGKGRNAHHDGSAHDLALDEDQMEPLN